MANQATQLATANEIRRSLADFARLMRGMREDHGLSASKLSALGRLRHAGHPLTAGEIARLEGLQPQSVTRVLADLEERGLISRGPSEADRRQSEIAITKKGQALLVRYARQQNEWLAHAMARLSPAERSALKLAAKLLDRLVSHEQRRWDIDE